MFGLSWICAKSEHLHKATMQSPQIKSDYRDFFFIFLFFNVQCKGKVSFTFSI